MLNLDVEYSRPNFDIQTLQVPINLSKLKLVNAVIAMLGCQYEGISNFNDNNGSSFGSKFTGISARRSGVDRNSFYYQTLGIK